MKRNLLVMTLLFVANLHASSAKHKNSTPKSKSSEYYEKPATHTVITITNTVPLPVPVPLPAPVPVPISTRNTDIDELAADTADLPMSALVQCDHCDDIETPWMSANSKKCSTWPFAVERCRDKPQYWMRNKFCQFTCATLGFPYDGDVCCNTVEGVAVPSSRPPTPSPSENPTPAPSIPANTNRNGDDNVCIECSDDETPWMKMNGGKECATWSMTLERCQQKTNYWKNNKFCQRTCSRLGYPYDGDGEVCCQAPTDSPTKAPSSLPSSSPSTHPSASPSSGPSTQPSAHPSASPSSSPTVAPSASPSSSPTNTPTRFPSSEPTALAVDSDSCVPCSNKPARIITRRGATCDSFHKTEDMCYDKRNSWLKNRYCELSCYTAGFPYDEDKKCCAEATPRTDIPPTASPSTPPLPPPTPQPTQQQCIFCTDDESPYMKWAGKKCESWSLIPYRCTERSSSYNFWSRERFCQKSCFDIGFPYPGDVCCPSSAPTPIPTFRPSPVPTYSPSATPSASPSSSPTAHPTSKDVEPDNCVVCDDVPTVSSNTIKQYNE